jgi:nickel/cobalt transporter (NicO) family protein
MRVKVRGRALAVVWLGLLVVLFGPGGSAALAHPLGNFTVNHYSRVELRGDSLRVRYVLDLAEIPSVQETRIADSDGDGEVSPAEWDVYKQHKAAEINRQLDLMVDGEHIQLRTIDVNVSQPLGQGDIPLVRLEAWFEPIAPMAANVQHQAALRDRSDPARIGWREMVVWAGPGAQLADSSVPAEDVSDELRRYPDDLLQNPIDRHEARWSFTLDGSSTPVGVSATNAAATRPNDPFAALITAADLNPTVVLVALLGAALLGGIHAASPGHGKSIMAAYIVGTHGTVVHALTLALSVTVAHTTGVLVLGLLTVIASNVIFPEQLYPWLSLVSGALVLVVGSRLMVLALRRHEPSHEHQHHHEHEHPHTHRGLAPTWRGLFALGLAGGIVPSSSALVVLLSSVALGRLGFGLVLIVAFGLGMAVVLVTTGVLLVHAGRFMRHLFPDDDQSPVRQRLGWAVPIVSASVMTLLGGVATFEGLTQLRLLGR